MSKTPLRAALLAATALVLVACQADEFVGDRKHLRPLSYAAQSRLSDLGMEKNAPIMMRIFKQEGELEIWKQARSGSYELFKTYEICRWSGELGPKFAEGDRQAPEGFYEVTPAQMNPNSKYYLSFNLGFPNAFDRSHDRTGSHLMVHGACSSAGCYAMTDEQMQEIYSMAREAFSGGQKSFQVQAFPFRMNAENFVKHRDSEHMPFWTMLKEGHDHFEAVKQPPRLDVCERRYVFNGKPDNDRDRFRAREECPTYSVPEFVAKDVAERRAAHEIEVAALLQKIKDRQERADKWEERGKKVADLLDFSDDEDGQAEPAAEVAGATTGTVSEGTPIPIPAPGRTAIADAAGSESGSMFNRLTRFVPGFGVEQGSRED